MDLLTDIASGFVLGVTLDFVALGFSRMFRAFRLVGDAG
jgi:hypothetical protein